MHYEGCNPLLVHQYSRQQGTGNSQTVKAGGGGLKPNGGRVNGTANKLVECLKPES